MTRTLSQEAVETTYAGAWIAWSSDQGTQMVPRGTLAVSMPVCLWAGQLYGSYPSPG